MNLDEHSCTPESDQNQQLNSSNKTVGDINFGPVITSWLGQSAMIRGWNNLF